MPPVTADNYYTSCQSLSYPTSTASGFMSRAEGAGFANALQASTSNSSSQPWPASNDPWPALSEVHRPAFPCFPMPPNESSVEDFCTAVLHNSVAVGSDSLSSGSPITELFDRGNSPTPLPGTAMYGGDPVNPVIRQTVATSPIDSLQLSRSLPVGARFNSSRSWSPFSGGHLRTSPLSHQSSFFVPPASIRDDTAPAGTRFHVCTHVLY